MSELNVTQITRLMGLAKQIERAVDDLRDAAATALMCDAKQAVRTLYRDISSDAVLPAQIKGDLVAPLESAWSTAVSGGALYRRTHGAIHYLTQADQYVCGLLAQGTMH